MGLFVYTQKGSIISMVDLPTTEIIEPIMKRDESLSFSCSGKEIIKKAPSRLEGARFIMAWVFLI